MTWTATSCDNLKYALPVGGTTLELASAAGTTDLCALIGDPAARHVVLEVYTASGSETVIAYGCKEGAVQVTRANSGSTEASWPAGACVRTVQIIEGALCGAEDSTATDSCCSVSTVWGGVTVCPELDLDLTNPDAPVLCLKPSGVAAGDRCGGRLKVDTYGRITYMAPDFPQACLPVFDPCACGDTGGGVVGSVTADDVSFTGAGGCMLTSGTVQQALVELEAYVCSISPSGGLVGVVEGAGIDITGGPSLPTISLLSLGVAGTYGGFTVNDFGQITGYSVPPASGLPLALDATDPLHVTQSGAGVYVFTVDNASETDTGVVQLASQGDFAADIPIPSDRVISWGFLQLWWDKVKNFICDLTNVPALTETQRAAAKIPVCVDGTTVSISPADLVTGGGGAFARVYVDDTGAVIVSDNVNAVTPLAVAAGPLVTLQNPAPTGYHVYVSQYTALPLVPVITVIGPTQFHVAWYKIDGTGQFLDPLPWSAAVFLGGS